MFLSAGTMRHLLQLKLPAIASSDGEGHQNGARIARSSPVNSLGILSQPLRIVILRWDRT